MKAASTSAGTASAAAASSSAPAAVRYTTMSRWNLCLAKTFRLFMNSSFATLFNV